MRLPRSHRSYEFGKCQCRCFGCKFHCAAHWPIWVRVWRNIQAPWGWVPQQKAYSQMRIALWAALAVILIQAAIIYTRWWV